MTGFFQKILQDITGSGDDQNADEYDRDVRPASEDPYGDPADEYANARPASEDPYGDPADEGYA